MPKGSKPVDDKDLPDWIKDIDKDWGDMIEWFNIT
jgi:hypothetical protein